jgi:serine/threonine protein kinase/alpha-tubulin suppressor-like RCC1 family protein
MIFARDFRVVRPLSAGGMGAVYIVEQLSTQRPRALKIMLPDIVRDPVSRARFSQEATVAGRIKSDHVVEVVSAGIDEATGTPWIAMELLEGEELAKYVAARGPLPPAEVMEILRQLGHGLGAAHRAGLVHRDLKPENIFLCAARREGVAFMVKILDFGIAKVVGESRTSAQSTSSMGSPMWMAPEQAEQGQIRPATDVWALGLIAFHLLTGRFYWRAANSSEVTLAGILKEIFVDAIEPPSMRAAQMGAGHLLPPGFDGWFQRAVVRDPTQRFGDASEAIAHLLPLLGSAAGVAPNAMTYPGLPPQSAPPQSFASIPPQPSLANTPMGYPTPPQPPHGGYVSATQGWSATQGMPSAPGPWSQPHPAPRGGGNGVLLVGVGLLALGLLVAIGALALRGSSSDGDGGVTATPSLPSIPGLTAPTPQVFRGPQCRGTGTRADIPGLAGVVQISAGRFHTCAAMRDGTARCWGWNANKQLGDGTTEDQYSPMTVSGLSGVVRVAAGQCATCALQSTGFVACWGLTARGERPLPYLVAGVSYATAVTAGEMHACARRSDGTVWCWGLNGNGEVGDGTRDSTLEARQVRGLANITQVSAGGFHTCALRADGTVWCWGQQEHGELGNGRRGREPGLIPTPVLGIAGATQVAAGEYHTCALLRGGAVTCWGANDQGAVGGEQQGNVVTPTPVPGLSGLVRISAGYTHNCGVRGNGAVVCWGANTTCQIGVGGLMQGRTPMDVESVGAVADVSAGGMHTCALRPNGAARCWGYNNYGQVGNGGNSAQSDIAY